MDGHVNVEKSAPLEAQHDEGTLIQRDENINHFNADGNFGRRRETGRPRNMRAAAAQSSLRRIELRIRLIVISPLQ